MTNFMYVVLKDHMTDKELGEVVLPQIPRKGEFVIIDGKKHWVEKVIWEISKNSVYKGKFNYDGVTVVVDHA